MDTSELIEPGEWNVASIGTDAGIVGSLRWRASLPNPSQMAKYPELLRVCWTYAEDGSEEFPDPDLMDRMETLEEQLCANWERDCLAVLTAVLTLSGVKQWFFYTRNAETCGHRLQDLTEKAAPYPIEVILSEDPTWMVLQEDVLSIVED